jgi:hypothetical protein
MTAMMLGNEELGQQPHTGRPRKERKRFGTFAHSPRRELRRARNFLIWIRCNPLKSLESAKEIQGFLLGFIWFYLDLLGANSRAG